MIVTKKFIAEGTTCSACEEIIKRQGKKIEGVQEIKFDISTEQGEVTYDTEVTNLDEILYKIEEKGYTCYIGEKSFTGKKNKTFGWIFGVLGVLIAGYFLFNLVEGINMPQISQGMGYGLLFGVGLLTSFHCVSMCGGFVISYTAKAAEKKEKPHKSHLMYGVGKTISYTIIGATFGLLGSFIAFTPTLRGVVGFVAGLFLVLFGLRMLNIFPILRKFQLRLPNFVAKRIGRSKTSSPLVIGLLNGLFIACGPLQAIYIMAAGTGSAIEGAKLLFIFGLGTLPVLLGFGYFASYVSGKATQKILKASGAIIIVLGLFMINNGLVLTGSGFDARTLLSSPTGFVVAESEPVMKNEFQEIRMEVTRSGWNPDKFVLQKGVPVKWIIEGKEINGCNNAIQVPKYGLEFGITKGEQVIEFTPTETGVVPWSCWMGMIPGTFIVKEGVVDPVAAQKIIDETPALKTGSCGGSCGNPSCGGATTGGCGCGG